MTVCPRCGKEKECETAQVCRNCGRLATNRTHYGRKRKVIEILGGKCVDCNLTLEMASYCHNVFDIHEISGIIEKQSKFRESALNKKMIEILRVRYLNGEVVLLCRNCHAIRHFKQWIEHYSSEEMEYLGFLSTKP